MGEYGRYGALSVRFLCGDIVVDTDRRELKRGREPIAVGPQVFDLLVCLIENRERVVSKNDLFETVWRGRIVSESTLTSLINAARKSVGDRGDEQKLIRTTPRKGFRFIGEITEEQTSPTPPLMQQSPGWNETRPAPALKLPDKPSIAVLPFQNLSDDLEQAYFADGVVEDKHYRACAGCS
jgi:DNA-binding winged helix-turn-helix (wHTH) protein